MTRVMAVDAKNDLYIGQDGSLALTRGIEATMQAAQQAAQAQIGEMLYATNQGMPNFQAVWNGSPNLSQFDAYLRTTLLAVDGVTAVTELTTAVAENRLTYSATIETIYGLGVING